MARGRGGRRGGGHRGFGRGHRYGSTNNRPKNNDFAKRKQYEEFGEAHPIEEKEARIKRMKVEDTRQENVDSDEDVESEKSDASVSEDEQGDTDVSKLLATFDTQVVNGKAVDSDEDDDDDDEEDDEEDDDDKEDDSDNNEDDGGEEENEEVEEEENEIDEDDVPLLDDSSDEVDSENESDGEEEEEVENAKEGIDDDEEDVDNTNETVDEVAESSEDEMDEGGESEEDKDANDEDDDDDKDVSPSGKEDPFVQHYERNLDEAMAEQVKDSEKWTSSFQKWPTLGRMRVSIPKVEKKTSKLLLLQDEEEDAPLPTIGVIPQPPEKEYNLDDYHVREVLQKNLPLANVSGDSTCPTSLTKRQKELFSVLSSYNDLYYPEATHSHWEEVQKVYAVHILNHVLKTRKRVSNHNGKWTKAQADKKRTSELIFRDQGYTRPTVLVLLPFKHSAYRLVETLVTLMFGDQTPNAVNLKRFQSDYGPKNKNKTGGQTGKLARPDDFQAIFEGDSNEDFKIGLKITNSSMKLYAEFYQSDILLASPLALRYIMSTSFSIDAESDFLSSLEILVLDQADIFLMQNWEHVLVLGEGVNQVPRNLQKLGTDLSRVRLWALNGHMPLYRQTIVFGSILADHNRAFVSKCRNFAGRIEVLNMVENGIAGEVVVPAEMVITRIPGTRDPDSRFRHFTQEILPRLRSGPPQPGTMVYVPDYCDYVRLLRYLKEDRGISVATINEYMIGEQGKVAKSRSLFYDQRRHLMLFTERFHFYRRYRIKGVRHVIFYDLPTYPNFFSEICNLMGEGNQNPKLKRGVNLKNSTVSLLVQRSDLTKLVGILGSSHAAQIIRATKPVHICTLGQ
ncbi:hypothetical protein Pcinc_037630 [Petrolisthes cinctipes]|uniref:Digestive organ expansion factor homolog n=1 Tax=Petrolisthes cinctipes TaxID=88211 RepID=A0AAE1BS91_PETCI|nr:hypothetical protein Pcinc_037630 [Petrolisthes cinctipes]